MKAYLNRSKSDANDAAAICEVVTRPSMRFVPIKRRRSSSRFDAAPDSTIAGARWGKFRALLVERGGLPSASADALLVSHTRLGKHVLPRPPGVDRLKAGSPDSRNGRVLYIADPRWKIVVADGAKRTAMWLPRGLDLL